MLSVAHCDVCLSYQMIKKQAQQVMRCYTMIVLTYWSILTLLHSFRHEGMLLFRLLIYSRDYAHCFERTPSSFKLKLKTSYTVSEVLLTVIQEKIDPQTIHN